MCVNQGVEWSAQLNWSMLETALTLLASCNKRGVRMSISITLL